MKAVGEMKHCPNCGETKPISLFNRDSHAIDGLMCWCKFCRSHDKKMRLVSDKKYQTGKLPKWMYS